VRGALAVRTAVLPTALLPIVLLLAAPAPAFERTEEREPCADHEPLRRPFFGDLHVHTRYSFDAYVSSNRNDPWAAYRFARGEPIVLPDEQGDPTIRARLRRPLDFAAITDHAEMLGPMHVCTEDPWALGYWWPMCVMSRSDHFWTQLVAASWWTNLGVVEAGSSSFACWLSDCEAGEEVFWTNLQRAAEDHYDRGSACRFTTFVGYEYSDAPEHENLHRNVIFRNAEVPARPVSALDTGPENFPELWRRLRQDCIESEGRCDVLAIPHNPNLSGGRMFRDPQTPEEARERLFFEPVIELTQHKASSECRYDRLRGRGLDTEDELCDFEQAVADNLSMLGTVHGEVRTERAAPVPIESYGRRNMARNALKDGLALGRDTGIDPFRFGFIGSTDTHSATPGAAEEDAYYGHLGRRDAGYRNVQDHFYDNPGGLAVVWAEENSRDAIFEALRRRETYATSGTRPLLRFFAGPELPEDLCADPERVAVAYGAGVPMGGELRAAGGTASPRFLASAVRDPGSPGHPGTDLQRLQVVKGWVDAEGGTHERVYDVAGDPDNGATVDPATCEPRGAGAAELCVVWSDPDFEPGQPAFYYARLLENPSCRWSTLQCQDAGVNPFAPDCDEQAARASAEARELGAEGEPYRSCCIDPATEPFYSPVIQERAWSSPIWIEATGGPGH